MFRYFNKKITIIILISFLFLIFESFIGICETDFIRAMMFRAASPTWSESLREQIGSPNIVALYKLGTLNLSLITFSILIFGVICGAIGVWLASKWVALYTAEMRLKTYQKIQLFSYEDIDKFSPSSLVTRITTDAELVNTSLSFSSKFIASGFFSIIFGVIKSSIDYHNWAFMYGITVPIIFVAMGIIVYFAMPYMKKGQKDTDDINKQVRETILGIRVVKAYNLENNQRNKFEKPNQNLTFSWSRAYGLIGAIMPLLQSIITGTMIIIYFLAFNNYDNIKGASEIIGFVGIMMQVLFGFIIIIVSITQIARSLPSFKRINEVTGYKPSLTFNENSTYQITKGEIEFKNVSHSFFNDDNKDVLKNINFKIKPKERIGIIGGTGSGKSTLINLIGRLFDASKGEVLIDGINVKDFSFNEINSKVAIAMQTATLFSGTIKSNIAYGLSDNLSEEEKIKEIEKAAKAAEAWEFIQKKDGSLDALVEQRGKNFSGGQKQRISIARTIAKKSKIVIFDDSTSALDTVTERKVQANIRKYNDATTIIVAQRISSVEELDRIIVMNDGEIVGFDTHWNLLANNEIYRSITASQLGTEELNEILRERGLKQIEK